MQDVKILYVNVLTAGSNVTFEGEKRRKWDHILMEFTTSNIILLWQGIG